MNARFELSKDASNAFESIERSSNAGRRSLWPEFFKTLEGHGSGRYLLTHLVLQGGGTLGIAHLGFVRGLEHANIRFAGLAGTSAGAIVALLIAAARGKRIETTVGETLLPILEAMPAATFMDGPYFARRFVKFALDKRRSGVLEFVLPSLGSWRRLLTNYGLHYGHRFEEWLSIVLSRNFEIETISDLEQVLLEVLGQLDAGSGKITKVQTAVDTDRAKNLLHITATAMPVGIKVVFPRDIDLFAQKYRQRSPAMMARASMSVPLFFDPHEMELNELEWNTFVQTKLGPNYPENFVRAAGTLRSLSFIDGGLLSNFPIDALARFEQLSGPGRRVPTIGVALVSDNLKRVSAPRGSVRALGQYVGEAFNAIRHLRDREALETASGDGLTEVRFVDTGGHNWLNFSLDADAVEDLYLRGLRSCATFLEKLDDRIRESRSQERLDEGLNGPTGGG